MVPAIGSKSKGTFLWNFVPSYGLEKIGHSTFTVVECDKQAGLFLTQQQATTATWPSASNRWPTIVTCWPHSTSCFVYSAEGRLGVMHLSLNSTRVVSSWHLRRHARHTSKGAARMSRVSGVLGDFPVQLATRLPDWSAGGLLRCTVLSVCPCVVSFCKFHEPDTHDLLRTSR